MKLSTTVLFFTLLLAGATRLNAQFVSANAAVTPALMMSFTGKAQNSTAELDWTMENQTNCKWFVIERAGENGSYDSINVVMGINNGNLTQYNFTDSRMLKGNNYYRLRQVDMDGIVRYSKVVTLTNLEAAGKMEVYPNPAIAVINYSVSSQNAQQVYVQVYSLSGIVMLSAQQQLSVGNNQQSLAISGLKSGNYILKVVSRTGASQYVQPFVKVM
ncbi:MAG: T9SS type A sorting domain-containing protein [Bacteroidetes bacterium]|nr:T9SS type A sorting domain-containing protein [Bacteroidota bacterium]